MEGQGKYSNDEYEGLSGGKCIASPFQQNSDFLSANQEVL